MLRASQQAEQTVAGGICDMTKLAHAGADEIRASLSALGLVVAQVVNAHLSPAHLRPPASFLSPI